MTRDDIIRMAYEVSDGVLSYDAEGRWILSEQEVIRLTALVAAAEREACANEIRRLREALKWARDVDCGCCSSLQEIPYLFEDLIKWADNEATKNRAAAIRARGEQEQPR